MYKADGVHSDQLETMNTFRCSSNTFTQDFQLMGRFVLGDTTLINPVSSCRQLQHNGVELLVGSHGGADPKNDTPTQTRGLIPSPEQNHEHPAFAPLLLISTLTHLRYCNVLSYTLVH